MKRRSPTVFLAGSRQQGVSLVVVLLIILIVLVLAIGTTAGLYVAGVFDNDDGSGQLAVKKPVKPKPPIYVPLEPPLVVNLDRNGRLGFLQVTVEVMTRESRAVTALEEHAPVIRNNLLMLLSGKTHADIAGREGKEALRLEALEEINRILGEQDVPGLVEDLYFTGFVMQ